MCLYKVGTQSSVLINEGFLFQRCPLREVPLHVVNLRSYKLLGTILFLFALCFSPSFYNTQ